MKPFSGSVIGYSGIARKSEISLSFDKNPTSSSKKTTRNRPKGLESTACAARVGTHMERATSDSRGGIPLNRRAMVGGKKGGNRGNGGIGHVGFVKSPVVYMGVSKNNGTSKSSTFRGFSIINHSFWGTPIFGNTHMLPHMIIYTGQTKVMLLESSYCKPTRILLSTWSISTPEKLLSWLDSKRGDDWPCHTCHAKWTW